MLSSGPGCIYWMSRHVERAENVARFIDVNHHLGRDLPPGMPPQWGPLLLTIGDDAQLFAQRYGKPSRDNVIRFLTFDAENSNSILACWRAAHENARSARNLISPAMWEELNEFCLSVEQKAAKQGKRDSRCNFLRQVKRASHLLEGIANATLTQGEAWHFGRLGRLLERAQMTIRMVDVKYFMAQAFSAREVGSMGPLHWKAVLQSAGAFEMYGRQYGAGKLNRAADFLIRDLQFPRSVRSCMRRANESSTLLRARRQERSRIRLSSAWVGLSRCLTTPTCKKSLCRTCMNSWPACKRSLRNLGTVSPRFVRTKPGGGTNSGMRTCPVWPFDVSHAFPMC